MAQRIHNIRTPRGRVYHNPNMKAVLEWNQNFVDKWAGRYSKAQKYVDSEVLRLSEPFVPFRTGMLVNLGILGTTIGEGLVTWLGPYAKFQYYGKVMVGVSSGRVWALPGEQKVVTDRDLQYHGGGLRGSFWFHRMKEVHGRGIVEGARRMMR